MDFYAQAATTVLSLITRFGATAAIRRPSKTYNEVTGEITELNTTAGSLKALVLPIASTPKGIFTEADNKLIETLVAGKARFMLAAAKGASFEPVANDVVEYGGEKFVVLGCTPLSPAGTPLLYKIALEIAPATPANPAPAP